MHWAFFDTHLQHRWSLGVFELRQKATLSVFNAFLKLGVERWKIAVADPELQEKLKYYSFQKRIQLMEQLWEQDFKREAETLRILHSRNEVSEWLQRIAEKQEAPKADEGCELFGWVDASGRWHEP